MQFTFYRLKFQLGKLIQYRITDILRPQMVEVAGDCFDFQQGLILVNDVQPVLLAVIMLIGSVVL